MGQLRGDNEHTYRYLLNNFAIGNCSTAQGAKKQENNIDAVFLSPCKVEHPLSNLSRMLTWNSVIAAVICQIVFLNRIKSSSDLIFQIWPVTLCTQLVQCLSILATCLVYLRPFLDSLETGFIQVGDLKRQHVPGFGYNPEGGSQNPKETRSGLTFSSLKSKLSRSQHQDVDIELQDNAGAEVGPGNIANAEAEHHDWDANSRSRILRTTTWTVEERDRENSPVTLLPSA